jgi:hypothetical protein
MAAIASRELHAATVGVAPAPAVRAAPAPDNASPADTCECFGRPLCGCGMITATALSRGGLFLLVVIVLCVVSSRVDWSLVGTLVAALIGGGTAAAAAP